MELIKITHRSHPRLFWKYMRNAMSAWHVLIMTSFIAYRWHSIPNIYVLVHDKVFIGGMIISRRFSFIPPELKAPYRELKARYPNLLNASFFVIEKDARRKGYGSHFIAELKKLRTEEGCWFTTFERNLPFYQAQGFEVIATEQTIPRYRIMQYKILSFLRITPKQKPEKLALCIARTK